MNPYLLYWYKFYLIINSLARIIFIKSLEARSIHLGSELKVYAYSESISILYIGECVTYFVSSDRGEQSLKQAISVRR